MKTTTRRTAAFARALMAFCALCGTAKATDYSYDANTSLEALEITENSTLSGGKTISVTNLTGSSDTTLTITNNTTLNLYRSTSWNTSLPAFNIGQGSYLRLDKTGEYNNSSNGKKAIYFAAPVHGEGTLVLYSYYKSSGSGNGLVFASPTNSTFSGTIEVFHRQAGTVTIGAADGPAGDYFLNRPELKLDNYNNSYSGPLNLGGHIVTHPLKVRGIYGNSNRNANSITASDSSVEGIRFIDVELTANYAFYGKFTGEESSACQVGLIVGQKQGASYTQTLAGANTTYGGLIVTNGATVALTGTWENGPVAVNAGATLTLNAAKTFASLTLTDSATLTLASASAGITVGTMEVGEGNTALIALTDSTALATAASEGTKLIAWTTKPTGGSFAFASSELNKSYQLVAEDAGLTVLARETALEYTGVWTGLGSDSSWSNVLNWENYMAPGENDTAIFPALTAGANAHKVTVDSATVAGVIVNGDVELVGARQYTRNATTGNSLIYTTSVTGSGTVTLGNNAGFGRNTARSSLTIETPLMVSAEETTPAAIAGYWYNGNNTADASSIYIKGAITGSGHLCFSGMRLNCSVTGSIAAFEGTIEVVNDGIQRNATHFSDFGKKAKYNIVNTDSNDNSFLDDYGKDLTFPELSGSPNSSKIHGSSTYTWEIGSANTSFTLYGKYHYTENANYYNDALVNGGIVIKKVGSGTVSFGGTWTHGLEVAEGTMHLNNASTLSTKTRSYTYVTPITFTGGTLQTGYTAVSHEAEYEEDGETLKTAAYTEYVPIDPSANITNSTATIIFDDEGTNRIWSTALAASNTGGFTKKGAGTLTLSETPQYTGTTRIEAGQLVIDDAADAFDTSRTVIVVADPAAAMAAGTVFLKVKSATGTKPVLETAAAYAGLYTIVRSDDEDGYTCYGVDKVQGLTIIVR